MRDKLAVLLVADEGGGVAVQLFEDPAAASASFGELKGRAGDPRRRATLVVLGWSEGGVEAEARSRDLPAPPAEAPDGWVLGEGPRGPEAKG
jgi:hypothetical protein